MQQKFFFCENSSVDKRAIGGRLTQSPTESRCSSPEAPGNIPRARDGTKSRHCHITIPPQGKPNLIKTGRACLFVRMGFLQESPSNLSAFLLKAIFHFPVRTLVKECPHTFAVFVVTCDLKAFHDTNTPRTMTIGSFKKENLLHKLVLSGTSTCRTYSVGGSDEKLF